MGNRRTPRRIVAGIGSPVLGTVRGADWGGAGSVVHNPGIRRWLDLTEVGSPGSQAFRQSHPLKSSVALYPWDHSYRSPTKTLWIAYQDDPLDSHALPSEKGPIAFLYPTRTSMQAPMLFSFRGARGGDLTSNVTNLSRSLKRGWIDEHYLPNSPLFPSPSLNPPPRVLSTRFAHYTASGKLNFTASFMAFNYEGSFYSESSTTSSYISEHVRIVQNFATTTPTTCLTSFPPVCRSSLRL